MRLKTLFAALVAGLVAAAPANGAFFPAETVDGPAATIGTFGQVDLAPDGTGALGYVKGGDVYVATLENGVWGAPAEVAANFGDNAEHVRIAAANGGKVLVVFRDNEAGDPKIVGAFRPGSGQPFGSGVAVVDPEVGVDANIAYADVSPSGQGYVVWQGSTGVFADVRVARVDGGQFTPLPDKLNADLTDGAGGVIPPNLAVAVNSAGDGVVFYNELGGADTTAFVRRLSGTTAGPPIQFSVDPFEGQNVGQNNGTMLDIDLADDGSAWAVARLDVDDAPVDATNDARGVGRRLVGDAFGDAVSVDQSPRNTTGGDDDGGERPQVDLNAAGNGLVAADRQLTDGGDVGLIGPGGPSAFVPLGGGTVNAPQPAIGGDGTGTVGYQVSTAFAAIRWNGAAFEGPQTISGAFGDVGGIGDFGGNTSADGQGNVAYAFLQGAGANTHVVAGAFDAPPSAPVGTTTEAPRRDATPALAWNAAADLWGGVQSYAVTIDGAQVGTTPGTTFVAPRLGNGDHTWTVTATDRRGQATTSLPRTLVVDTRKPSAKVRIKGKRRVRKKLRFIVTARDASGIARVQIRFGDKKKASKRRLRRNKATFAHRYKKAKRYKVKITATDKAGNKKVVRKRIRIRQ